MRLWGYRHFRALLVGMQSGTCLIERNWQHLTNLHMHSPFDLEILLRIYPENTSPTTQKYVMSSLFAAALLITAKYWKQSKCLSVGEWLSKLWHSHTMKWFPGYIVKWKKQCKRESAVNHLLGKREGEIRKHTYIENINTYIYSSVQIDTQEGYIRD